MSQQFHHIPGLLKPAELEELDRLIPQLDFTDGRATASMAAKEVKNNLQADGSVKIPEALRPYMGGNAVIEPKK